MLSTHNKAGPVPSLPCPRAETYLLFSNLLHQFRVAGVPGAPPCLEGDPGITLGPMVYSVMVARRGANTGD